MRAKFTDPATISSSSPPQRVARASLTVMPPSRSRRAHFTTDQDMSAGSSTIPLDPQQMGFAPVSVEPPESVDSVPVPVVSSPPVIADTLSEVVAPVVTEGAPPEEQVSVEQPVSPVEPVEEPGKTEPVAEPIVQPSPSESVPPTTYASPDTVHQIDTPAVPDSNGISSYVTAFFAKTYTQSDARKRVNILETAVETALYTQGGQQTLQSVVSSMTEPKEPDKKEVLTFLSAVNLPRDSGSLKKIVAGIKEEIISRPSVTLTISFEPNAEQVSAYGEWFRLNVNPQVLINMIMSADVVGGASITWQGKQVTYDLKYLLHQRRNELVAIVDKYVGIKKKEVVI